MTAYDDAVLALSPTGYYKVTNAADPGVDLSGNGLHLVNSTGSVTGGQAKLAPELEDSTLVAERVYGTSTLYSAPSTSDSISLAGWGQVVGGRVQTLFGTNGTVIDNVRLRVNADLTLRGSIGGGAGANKETTGTIPTGARFIGFVWDFAEQEMRFYIDGQHFETVGHTQGFDATPWGLVIGARSASAGDFFNEKVSHAAVFHNQVLTESDFATLYDIAQTGGSGPGASIYMASDESLGDWKREPENGSHASAIAVESDAARLVLFASDYPSTYRGKWEEPEVTPAPDGTYIAHVQVGRFGTVDARARLRIYEGGGSTPGAGTLLGEVNQVLNISGYQTFNVNIDEPTDWNNLYGELVGEQP